MTAFQSHPTQALVHTLVLSRSLSVPCLSGRCLRPSKIRRFQKTALPFHGRDNNGPEIQNPSGAASGSEHCGGDPWPEPIAPGGNISVEVITNPDGCCDYTCVCVCLEHLPEMIGSFSHLDSREKPYPIPDKPYSRI